MSGKGKLGLVDVDCLTIFGSSGQRLGWKAYDYREKLPSIDEVLNSFRVNSAAGRQTSNDLTEEVNQRYSGMNSEILEKVLILLKFFEEDECMYMNTPGKKMYPASTCREFRLK